MKGLVAVALLGIVSLTGTPARAADFGVNVRFSDDEIRIIEAWYSEHDSGARHGNGNRHSKGLPPGIARNLARGKALPPGIAKQSLPDGLVRALPPPPRGYERIVVDGKLLLVEIATQVIHDILSEAVLR